VIVDRFNFYDVYGYLIPGLTFITLLWLPFGIVTGKPPDDKLASLVVVLLLAYVIGHFLQAMATNAFSSQTERNSAGKPAFPSVVLLDKSNTRMGHDLKRRVHNIVQSWFSINVAADEDSDEDIAQRRQDAYFICRPVVNAGKSYAEQFQGLYSMMRGLSLALLLAVSYDFGWALAVFRDPKIAFALQVLGGECVLALAVLASNAAGAFTVRLTGDTLTRSVRDRYSLGVIALLLLCVGYLVGSRMTVYYETAAMLAVLGTVLFAIAMRFFAQYKSFTVEHAKSVWAQIAAERVRRPAS